MPLPLVRSLTLPTLKRRRRPRPQAHSSAAAVEEQVPRESYRWAVEIEIEFSEPRLGVSLREVVASTPAVEDSGEDHEDTEEKAEEKADNAEKDDKAAPPFFAEVDALPKPARGRKQRRAGAAELYNWSVPEARRLVVGMRLTGINDAHLAGWSYGQVVRALQAAGRPVRLRFADVSKGTLPAEEDGECDRRSDGTATSGEDEPPRGATQLLRLRADELASELVTRELRVEHWRLSQRRKERANAMLAAKSLVLERAVSALEHEQRALKTADETLKRDRRRLERMLSDLKAQEAPGAVRPEVERARRLEERQALLLRNIERLEAGNERLTKERGARRRALDAARDEVQRVEAELRSKEPPADAPSEQEEAAVDEWLEDNAAGMSMAETLTALRRTTRAVEEELERETLKLAKARHERRQLRKRADDLSARANGERML